MEFIVKQVSSLEKIQKNEVFHYDEVRKKTALAGERFSYQICAQSDGGIGETIAADVSVESAFGCNVKLYLVKDVYLDKPYTHLNMEGEDFLTNEPCFMPDVLIPIEEQKNMCYLDECNRFWVKVDIPKDTVPGKYTVTVNITPTNDERERGKSFDLHETMEIEVISAVKEPQKLIYTRWFHADCVAIQHGVEIYSEAHWELIEKYIAAAADVGVNMILVPIHTPPLDTAIGTARPCVQLVDIEKTKDGYVFSFEKFKRFIDICKKNGIQYFEMAHLFSQWGAKCAPNIMVTENGKKDYMFGWHVAADSDEYVDFLKQYIAALSKELDREEISQNTYFHISDEPAPDNMDRYKTASDIIRPLIGQSKTFDALSNYVFYEKGLVECPVTFVKKIHNFLEHDVPNQWLYYCCVAQEVFTNCYLAMPSYRVRILGYLLYKYDIKGFLHWGLNFYYSKLSKYPINPYLTTSAEGVYPSGEPYIVYPSKDGVYPSIRGEVTYEAIQDMDICRTLEQYIGRDAVVKMIDEAAGVELRFDQYPKSKEFVEGLRTRMIEKLGTCCRGNI